MFSDQHKNRFLKYKNNSLGDIKGEIYSLIKTAEILDIQHRRGLLESEKYYFYLKEFYMDLMALKYTLISRGKTFFKVIGEITEITGGDGNRLINMILTIPDFGFGFDGNTVPGKISPLELGKTLTEITSEFITLLDYLHLIDEADPLFVLESLHNLIDLSSRFIFLESITMQLSELELEMRKEQFEILKNPEYLGKLENRIAMIFDNFKRLLD